MTEQLHFSELWPHWPELLAGLWVTVQLTVLATIGGLIVGAAFVLPIALLTLVGFGLWRAIVAVRKPRGDQVEQPSSRTQASEAQPAED